jgi:hypothetical protein
MDEKIFIAASQLQKPFQNGRVFIILEDWEIGARKRFNLA